MARVQEKCSGQAKGGGKGTHLAAITRMALGLRFPERRCPRNRTEGHKNTKYEKGDEK